MIVPNLDERLEQYKMAKRRARAYMRSSRYATGAIVVGGITFVASWIYCVITYGFLLGVGLGWLPSIITAIIAGAIWPVLVIGGFVVAIVIAIVIASA